MKTRHVLYGILALVAVLLFLTYKRFWLIHHHKNGKARTKMAVKAASLPATSTPCDFLAEDYPNAKEDCQTYLKTCGLASTVTEVLNIEESASGSQDPRVNNWIKLDALAAQADPSLCAPASQCPGGQQDCPSEFPTLKCVKGACV